MPPLSPEDLFRAGRLAEAIAAQSAVVRAAPTDTRQRWFLGELLCLAEDWERADRLFDLIALQTPDMEAAALALRRLLRGEQTRRQVMEEGRAPQIIGTTAAVLQPVVEALLFLREGQPQEAALRIEAAAMPAAGTRNGTPFDGFRDLDDLCAPFVEFITEAGDYHWVAIGDIAVLETRPLSRARDLLWQPARLEIRDGPAGDVSLPAIYVVPAAAAVDDAARLGRRSEWLDQGEGLVRGLGLRVFLVGDDDVPIRDLGRLVFAPDARAP
jgi:type VI secretion system protein ImpE